MLAFTFLCISFLLSLVHASPLALRVVFSPHITSPNANSVWSVGSKQFVTWETADIPPDSELTNPNGKVLLGHEGSDGSLNLDVEHPLAQNFKLRAGKIQITVPDVAPREDYLVVLMGDSGNASPAFAITKITGRNVVASGSSSSSVTQLTSLITTPIPITGPSLSLPSVTTVVEPTTTDSTPSGTSTSPVTTATSPVTSPTTSATSGSSAGTSSGTSSGAAPSSTQGNSASSVLKSTGLKMTFGLATLVLVLLI